MFMKQQFPIILIGVIFIIGCTKQPIEFQERENKWIEFQVVVAHGEDPYNTENIEAVSTHYLPIEIGSQNGHAVSMVDGTMVQLSWTEALDAGNQNESVLLKGFVWQIPGRVTYKGDSWYKMRYGPHEPDEQYFSNKFEPLLTAGNLHGAPDDDYRWFTRARLMNRQPKIQDIDLGKVIPFEERKENQ